MERALLVTVVRAGREAWTEQESALELWDLASSCGLEPIGQLTARVQRPNSKYFIGSGKAEEIAASAAAAKAGVVVFGWDLSGAQQRNLEEVIGRKTINRTQLILDVFARRARSLEGKLQVELAQLNYLLPRLAGKGIYLSQQAGGIGTRGPGETKLEMDRRRIRDRIRHLAGEVKKVGGQRERHRAKRAESGVPTAALVGYTNAGKSTLFNALTGAGVRQEERMFTTLDPTVRKVVLPGGQNILLVDTVGFLHLLPHDLIDAFKATLEEVSEADVLIHVLDAAKPNARKLEASVLGVLEELRLGDRKRITALNKTDNFPDAETRARVAAFWPDGVLISAKRGDGLEALLARVADALKDRVEEAEFLLPYRSKWVSRIHDHAEVLEQDNRAEGVYFRVRLNRLTAASLKKRIGAESL